jgi:hypothetical protein
MLCQSAHPERLCRIVTGVDNRESIILRMDRGPMWPLPDNQGVDLSTARLV